MSLGETIYRLRTTKNLSQGELAEMLGVSRQSISKYENNSAVPDLDKVVKLSEIFGVSLDELVKGEKPVMARSSAVEMSGTSDEEETLMRNFAEKEKTSTDGSRALAGTAVGFQGRKLAGTILLCMAFLVALIFVVMGNWLAGAIFAIPFLLCGLICFICKKHVGLWCGWVAWMYVDIYLMRGTGSHWSAIRYTFQMGDALKISNRLAFAWVQFLAMALLVIITVWKRCKEPMIPNKKYLQRIVALWGIVVAVQVVWLILPHTRNYYNILLYIMASGPAYILAHSLVDWGRVIVFTVAVVNTVRYFRGRHKR